MTINKSDFPPYKSCPIASLLPYARNARTHSDAQVAQIAASIREFGFTNPILVDAEGGVIAGHGRLLAARKLGMTEVPTLELAHLTPAQRRAYVLADNRLALSAGWDEDLLRIELTDLEAEGFNLELTGFDLGEIAGYLADPTAGLTDPDDIPEAPVAPISCLGDVWLLGRHRLVCGDSTTVESVDKALAGVKPHLMVTDPPYGVEYDANWRNTEMTGRACHAVELSPAYVDVAVLRWQTFTGQAATLEGDGSTFATLATTRSPAAA